jgi:tRNA modification GTPase
VLELQGHGGPVVMQMLLRRCQELGARLAHPGEFTRRAFLNDRLDLAQAEGVADIIEASTETAARSALRSLRGEFSENVNSIGKALLSLRTWVEATLDFPEEEISDEDSGEIAARLDALLNSVEQALAKARQGSILRTGLNVVLSGQPNVGKSSLLNRLAGEEIAIVTDVPGTTRDSVRQTIQVHGIPLNIVDTAGLRESSDLVETLGIARAWDSIDKADVILLVMEAGKGVTAADEAILSRLPAGAKRITVYNKIDLGQISPELGRELGDKSVCVSAKTGAGIDRLQKALQEAAGWQSIGEDVFMGRERHIAALATALDYLGNAKRLLQQPELMAEELRLSHQSLGSITGEVTAEDLLGEIFSRFCIGK